MIKVNVIYPVRGKKLCAIRTKGRTVFTSHIELESFRMKYLTDNNLTDVRFLYTDFNPKICKCGRQMVFDVVKNKYVCDCN
jgi:hypothetical protein